MITDKGIQIKNIFYMLSYAYQVLRQSNFKKIESEPFDNVLDLFAAILSKGMSQQVKQGLHKEYVSYTDDLTKIKGKLNINGTIDNRIRQVRKITCEFDELTVDNRLNQILKSTAVYLLKQPDDVVRKENKKELRDALRGFCEVSEIPKETIQWNTLTYHRNNQSYKMLTYICYFVLTEQLISTTAGEYKMPQYTDEHMSALYEKFILEYYLKHHPELSPTPMIMRFQMKENISAEALGFLPQMKTDITLTDKKTGKTLIIDAKYYKKIWQSFDALGPEASKTIRNGHLYQIMTYVKTREAKHPDDKAGGMLLYAQTGNRYYNLNYPDLNGNHYYVRTLDLNKDFEGIRNQLEEIVEDYFSKDS